MGSKKVEKGVVAFVRQKGGTYKTCRQDVIGDILRASRLKNVTRQALEQAIDACVSKGDIVPLKSHGQLTGFKLA